MMALRKYRFGKTALGTCRLAFIMAVAFSLMLGPFAHAYIASTSCTAAETAHSCCCGCTCEPEEAQEISYVSHDNDTGCTCGMQAESIPITAPFEAQTPAMVDIGIPAPAISIVVADDLPSNPDFIAIPEITVRDTGPPLYISHSSFLI